MQQIELPKQPELSKFDILVRQNELKPDIATKLYDVLNNCEIVLLCDDSGSMASKIIEPDTKKSTTRWLEEKKLASVIIEYVTSINPNGLDIYFLNRGVIRGVKNMNNLQQIFMNEPTGGTPLIGSLKQIMVDKSYIPQNKNLLIVVITDGEPTDYGNSEEYKEYNRNQLFRLLSRKQNNVHTSFVECTDNEEDMDYLDKWDRLLVNFDNTDDYREELRRVKLTNGQSFKFDYTDYVIKILLATFYKQYFNLDQGASLSDVKYSKPINKSTSGSNNGGDCCVLL